LVTKADVTKKRETLLNIASRVFTISPDRSSKVPKPIPNSPSIEGKLSTENILSRTDSKTQIANSPSKNDILKADEVSPVHDQEEQTEKKDRKSNIFGFGKLKGFRYKNEKKSDEKLAKTAPGTSDPKLDKDQN
jgi:hypothetical protein